MKQRIPIRMLSILLVLLIMVPTSAFAITYQELAAQVAAATTDTTITLDDDLHQAWWDDAIDDVNPDYAFLVNNNGVRITIDGANHSIQGLALFGGIFTILNATIYGDEYDNGIWVSSWGQGNVVDLTLDRSVTVEQGTGFVSIAISAGDEATARFQSEAQHDEHVLVSNGGAGTIILQGTAVPVPVVLGVDEGETLDANGLPNGLVLAAGSSIRDYSHDVFEDEDGVYEIITFTLIGSETTDTEPPQDVDVVPDADTTPIARTKVDREVVNGITGSPLYLKKLYISYMSLNASLYANGEKVLFKQRLFSVKGNTMVRMQTLHPHDELGLGITRDALAVLVRAGVYTIRVANGSNRGDTFVDYDTRLLLQLAEEAGLAGDQEIYITAPDADIQLRAADGTLSPL